jgi:glycosyltransferase involved in cell wall biosynthesis
MRIGLDARMYHSSTGGIGTYSRQLIKNLIQLDQKNRYFIFLTKEGFREYQKHHQDQPAGNFKPILTNIPHYSLLEQISLPRILKKYRLDLVHFLHFNHPIFYRGKYIISIHDLTITKFSANINRQPLIKRISYKLVLENGIKNSILISSLSQKTKKDIIAKYPVDSEKIKVIPLAVDQEFAPAPDSQIQSVLTKYQLSQPYLLFVGQWRPHKGINYLLKAMKLLHQRFNQKNIRLVITGRPAHKFSQLNDQISQATKQGLVETPGFVKNQDLPALYSGAKLFVFPSLCEGFGLPPLEAMACSIPVASSRASCLPEVLGSAPLYFDPRDPADIALKINTLLTNYKLADKLIERGQQQVKKYSWQKTAQKTLKLYQEATALPKN